MEWTKTDSGDRGIPEPTLLAVSEGSRSNGEGQRAWTPGKSVVSQVGDVCAVASWVFYSSSGTPSFEHEINPTLSLGGHNPEVNANSQCI